MISGMLGCDMVGFHTEDYCLNFLDCCQRCLGCRVDRNNMLVEHCGRTVKVKAMPIGKDILSKFPSNLKKRVSGIPFDNFVSLSKLAPRVYSCHCKVILGVDRLDYTKGLISRLKSFQRLLIKYPRWKEKVMLLQVAVPSRHDQMLNSVYFCNLFILRTDVKEYKELKEEIDKLVGCINGQFSTPAWSPIRWVYL